MKSFWVVVIVLILLSCAEGQVVQEEVVMGFQDGLINSLPNNLMPATALLVMNNYDVTAEGWLKRRKGMSVHYPDTRAGHPTWAIIPYYSNLEKEMLILNVDYESNPFNTPYHLAPGAISVNLGVLRMADDAAQTFSLDKAGGFYYPRRLGNYPYNLNYASLNQRTVIAATNSEMVLFDGENVFPARPLGPGQPKVAVINGGGPLTGRMKYKYCYFEDGTNDTSNFSSPSWEVNVFMGYVYIWGFSASPEAGIDSILLYRSSDGGNYEFVTNLPNSASTYCLDSITTVPGDTVTYHGGAKGHQWAGYYPSGYSAQIRPPGGFAYTVPGDTTLHIFGAGLILDTANIVDAFEQYYHAVATYAIVYIDSAGRESYMSPAAYAKTNGMTAFNKKVVLTGIPVSTNPIVEKKLLLKRFPGDSLFYLGTANPGGKIFVLDTLDNATTTYTDSIRYDSLVANYPEWCVPDSADDYIWQKVITYPFMVMPEITCYDDSVIAFQPVDIAVHGNRMFTIGHPLDRNRVYYSDFGRMTTWPYDKFIPIGTPTGDWLVRLMPLGKALVMFRQNSIYGLTGFSFYQYSIEMVTSGIGLSASRALAVGNDAAFFLHKTGIYQFAAPPQLISSAIKNSLDSIGPDIQRSWAGMVGDEAWFSVPMVDSLNDRTYIFSMTPKPHWKAYDFGVFDGAQYDYDTTAVDFRPDRWIFIRDNDSLWRWDYSAADTMDGTVPITAVMQTKYFFPGPEREKIVYLDLFGSGAVDSLRLYLWDDYGDRVLVDSLTVIPDFSVNGRQRYRIDRIFTAFSVKVRDFGHGDYVLKGLALGYVPWDEGRKRP